MVFKWSPPRRRPFFIMFDNVSSIRPGAAAHRPQPFFHHFLSMSWNQPRNHFSQFSYIGPCRGQQKYKSLWLETCPLVQQDPNSQIQNPKSKIWDPQTLPVYDLVVFVIAVFGIGVFAFGFYIWGFIIRDFGFGSFAFGPFVEKCDTQNIEIVFKWSLPRRLPFFKLFFFFFFEHISGRQNKYLNGI